MVMFLLAQLSKWDRCYGGGRGEVGEMGAGVTSVVCQACDFSVSLPELSTFLYLEVMKMLRSLVLS